MKIALFGTSADPPTAAHQDILSWLSQHYDFVAVWAADNPFKSHQTPLKHRAAMLQLLIADICSPRQNVNLSQELSTIRTLETVEKARQRWGNAEFTLVVGSDLVTQLERWYRIEDLLRQVQLLLVPRPGYEINRDSVAQLHRLGGEIAIASITGLDISSSAYRQSGDPEALTPSVIAYINQEHLYECQDKIKKRYQLH